MLTLENTALVIDSTADLTPELVGLPGIYSIPLKVIFGQESFRDGIDLSPQEFYNKLGDGKSAFPSTSQPSPAEFIEVYEELKHYETVVSLHVSSQLSGTLNSATLAAGQAGSRIKVFDSRTTTLQYGLLVMRIYEKLKTGTTLQEIERYIEWYDSHKGGLVYVDTLEYLRRGGRIGRVAGIAGGLLQVKPLIMIKDGLVTPYKKVRSKKAALEAFQAYVEKSLTGKGTCYFVVGGTLCLEQDLEAMASMMHKAHSKATCLMQGEAGSVIATHIGPGALALFFIEEPEEQLTEAAV